MTLADDTSDGQTAGAPGSYLVVARRYRPQTFDDLVGQQHVAQALTGAIRSQRVGHAYLFTGARGVGKTSAARILAKALNCVQGPTPEPCNRCDVCQSVAAGQDVDVLEIDGASNRGIDEIRQLRHNVMIRPSRVRFKIYIIDEVHMLTKEAFNALLKTLEEPPGHVKFIFATTEPNKIPITILSRCQRYDFVAIGADAIRQRLGEIAQAEGVQIDAEALNILASRAGGSMRDSQSLLEQLLAVGNQQIGADDVAHLLGIAPLRQVAQLARQLAERQAADALAALDESLTGGVEPGQLLDQLLGYFRDVMAILVGSSDDALRFVAADGHNEAREIASSLGLETVLAILEILHESAARMRVSVHNRTLIELALIRIAHLEDLDALAVLAKQLSRFSDVPTASTSPANAAAEKKNASADDRSSGLRMDAAARSSTAMSAISTDEAPGSAANIQPTAPHAAPLVAAEGSVAALDTTTWAALWTEVCPTLQGMLCDFASQASDVSRDDGGPVEVWFDDEVALDFCNREDNRRQIVTALSQRRGEQLVLEMKLRPAAGAEQTPSRPRRRSKRQLQHDAADKPFVKQALDLFGADVHHLRIEPGEQADRKPPA